jgi:hypothetical protein
MSKREGSGDYKELAHVIMEAEKYQDLLSLIWRPRKTSGVNQSEYKGLESPIGINPSPRIGEYEMKCGSLRSEAGKKRVDGWVNSSYLCFLFYFGPQWESQLTLLIPSVQMTISSRNTFTDTPRNNFQSGYPVAQSN